MASDPIAARSSSGIHTSSRRGALRLLAGSTIGGLVLLSTHATEAKKGGKGRGKKKGKNAQITLCHHGQTITVSASVAKAHQGHGDTLGACAPVSGDLPIKPGSRAVVTTNVNLVAAPSPEAAIVVLLARGTVVTITGPAVTGNTFFTWWPVTDPNGASGYLQAEYLGPYRVPPPQSQLIITTMAADGGGPQRMAGVCYAVTDAGGSTLEACDTSNGIVTIVSLAPGTYVVGQTEVPAGYQPAPEQVVDVVAGQETYLTVTNEPG